MNFGSIPETHYIFPLAADSKVPLKGSSGFHDALLVAQAKEKWPDIFGGNVGLYPGPSGLLVIDVDVKAGACGEETLSQLEAKYGSLPRTYKVMTWSSKFGHSS